MSLSQALAAAASGLHANQVGMAVVAGNVANANTDGYVRRTVNQVATPIGTSASGVRVTAIQRQLSDYVLKQMRTENAGASYATARAQFYQRLQQLYGQPGTGTSINSAFDNFTSALQALSASPEDFSARSAVLSAGQLLAQQLNSMSAGVQSLRGDAENGIAAAVETANQAMTRIADINKQLSSSGVQDSAAAALRDQRDVAVAQLSQLMDISVLPGEGDQVAVYTSSGVQLVGLKASTLNFNGNGSITAAAQWNTDPTKTGVGTLTLSTPNGATVDLLRTNSIRSGQIAAYLQMRDHDLVQAQNQLDAIAAAMSQALSNKTTAGAPVTVGAQAGFDIDLGGLLAGNTMTVTYTDGLTHTLHTVNFVRVDDPSLLPLPTQGAGAGKTVGIDFSAGFATVVQQISDALSTSGISASAAGGTMLELLDGGGSLTINSVSTSTTMTSLTGSVELPFFQDGGVPYTGAYNVLGTQSTGLAGRINVNAALLADPSKLVLYQGGTPAGDTTRPDFIYQQMVSAQLSFQPNSGIGTAAAPFSGTLGSFISQVVSRQGEAATNADTLKQGQDVVLNSLQQRFSEEAGVNIDEEMTNLLNLQNSYAANARVMSVIRDMLDTLLRM